MLSLILQTLRSCLKSRPGLILENLALRHQLIVVQRRAQKPRLKRRDRLFWVLLSRLWTGWRDSLRIVQPDTVVRWHRRGFRWYWRRKCRGPGRPKVAVEVREIIRQMSRSNPTWGAPRIHGEFLKLGIEIGETTVAKYMVRSPKPPSLKKDCPVPRAVEPPGAGPIEAEVMVGGLHHQYFRRAV